MYNKGLTCSLDQDLYNLRNGEKQYYRKTNPGSYSEVENCLEYVVLSQIIVMHFIWTQISIYYNVFSNVGRRVVDVAKEKMTYTQC